MDFAKRPFPICPKPPFQNEAKRESIGMKMIIFILMQIKLIFARKIDSASFWKRDILELRISSLMWKTVSQTYRNPEFLFICLIVTIQSFIYWRNGWPDRIYWGIPIWPLPTHLISLLYLSTPLGCMLRVGKAFFQFKTPIKIGMCNQMVTGEIRE